jgi:hypothetical protein
LEMLFGVRLPNRWKLGRILHAGARSWEEKHRAANLDFPRACSFGSDDGSTCVLGRCGREVGRFGWQVPLAGLGMAHLKMVRRHATMVLCVLVGAGLNRPIDLVSRSPVARQKNAQESEPKRPNSGVESWGCWRCNKLTQTGNFYPCRRYPCAAIVLPRETDLLL